MWKLDTWRLSCWKLNSWKLPNLTCRSPQPNSLRQVVLDAKAAGQTHTAIVDKVSEQMYANAIADLGWLLDLGVWGPSLYRREAEHIVSEILRPDHAQVTDGG